MSTRRSAGHSSGSAARHAFVAIPLARLRHPRAALLAATALQVGVLTVVLLARPARAQSVAPTLLPTGGQVIGGTAAISRSGSTLTIDQSTANAAINWQNFSVGAHASVGFHVPTPQSTTINRVIGPDPSVIAGRLTSNGRVVIANQSGIVFANGAQVDVNALVASAPGITAANARAGKLIFDQPARPGARVVNNGRITIRQAGLAALVGPTVANNGVISAKLGHVILQGAAAATLDFYGDGLLSFDVTKQVTKTPSGATALVTNTGTIVAEGGTVTLSAAAVDNLVTDLVDAGGTIAAPSVAARTGSIVIDGTGGSVTIVGQLAAQGTSPGTTGGTIAVNATKAVTVASGARLDASGQAGGGTVAVGTTAARAKGGPTVKAAAAQSVTVAPSATLAADAWAKGDGGHVTVLALGDTDFAGHVEARGGAAGGNGGALEISGGHLQLTGGVDASAPKGAVGSLLLDPGNLKIISGGADGVTNGETYTAASTSSIDPTSIEAIAADVTLSSEGHISIESAVNVSDGFTLFAASSIVVDAAVSSAAGIEFGAGLTSLGGSGAGGITVNAAITSSGAAAGADSIVLSAGTDGIALNSNLNAKVVDLSATGGGVTQDATSVITAAILQSSNGIGAGDVWLIGTNAIDSLGSVAVTAGRFDLRDSNVLTLDGSVSFPGTASAGIAVGGLVEGTGSINGGTGLVAIGAFPTSDVLAIGTSGATTVSLDPAALAAITAGTLELVGTGINVAATASLTAIPTIDLEAGTGTITFTGGTFSTTTLLADAAAITQSSGVLSAGVLTTGTTGLGGVTLDGATNDIATISALGSLSGDLRVLDGTALTLNGSNQATNVVLSDTATGTAITLGGTLKATTLDLSASTGSVSQTGGTLAGAILQSASGIGGSLDLSAGSNTISALGSLAATGGLQLVDGTSVSIGSVVSVGSAETLSIADNGIGIAAGGSLSAPSGVVELGRVSSGGTVLLGTVGTSGDIAPGDLGAITAGTLRLGKTGLESVQAATILSGGTINAPNVGTLELDASGGVTMGNPVTLAPSGVLSGTMGSLSVTGAGNVIAGLGGVNAGSGAITVDDGAALTVTGTVTGGVVVLNDSATGSAITVAGSLTGTSSVELDAPSGAVVGQTAGAVTTPLLTSTTLANGITLAGTSDAIGTLGTLIAVAGGVTLVDGSALTLDAASIVSAAAGNVAISDGATGTAIALNGGTVSAFATLDLSAPFGSVAQTGGTLSAPTLASGSGVSGSLDLTGGSNTIGALGSLAAGGTLSLADMSALAITGSARAGGMSLQASGITLPGGSLISTGTIVLNPEGGGVSASVGGLISAGTLTFAVAPAGAVQLAGNNTIATLGSVDATGSAVDIVNTSSLAVQGQVTGASVTLDAPTLSVGGAVAGTTLVSLDAGVGGIGLSGTVLSPGGVVAISATGGVTQTGGTLSAGALESTSGIGGLLDLSGGSNTIGVLGALSANGGLKLVDTTLVSIGGVVSVGSGATLSIADDGLGIAAGGSLSAPGGVVELGPVASGGTILLGAVGAAGTIAPGSLAAVTAGTLRLGKTALNGNEVGTILSGGTITAPNIGTLELDASGGVTLGQGVALPGTLSGTMGSLSVTGTTNTIGSLGALNAGGGSITVVDSTALTVSGPVTGGTVVLNDGTTGPAITVTGSLTGTTSVELDAPSGSVVGELAGAVTTPLLTSATLADGIALAGTSNAIGTLGTLIATSGNVTIADGAALSLNAATDVSAAAGKVVLTDGATGTAITLGGGTVLALGALGLSAPSGSVVQTGGTLIVGTLVSGSGIGGSLDLTGGSNIVAALGPLAVSGGLQLVDTTSVTVAGMVSVGVGRTLSIADNGLGMAVGGALSAPSGVVELGPVSSGGDVLLGMAGLSAAIAPGDLSAITAGTLRLGKTGLEGALAGAITSGGDVDAVHVQTLELDASGGVSLATPLKLAAGGTLSGTMSGLTLNSTGNVIPVLGVIDAGTGTITVNDATALTVAGPLTGGSLVLSDSAAGRGIIIAGSLVGFTSVQMSAQSLSIGGSVAATSLVSLDAVAGPLLLSGTISSPTGLVEIAASGGVTQSGGAILAGTLAGGSALGGAVDLGSTQNAIGVLGSLSAPGQNVAITDAAALTVAGPVNAANLVLTDTASGVALTTAGLVTATGTLGLVAPSGSIRQAGGMLTAGVLDLSAPSGDVTQSLGGIAVGTLVSRSGIGGSLDLGGGSNTILGLGTLVAGGTLALVDASTLAVTGSVHAAGMSLQAAGITLPGGLLVTPGTVALNPEGDGVSASLGGLISAATLNFPDGPTGAVQLTGSNTITSLQTLAATGAPVDLVDGAPLTVLGPVSGATVTLEAPSLSVSGVVSATSLVSLDANAGPLLLSGTVASPGATVDIAASGKVTQSAGAIVAGTLIGGSALGGAVDLGSTLNTIGVLGPLSTPGQPVAITDGASLTVAGPVVGSAVTLSAPTLSLSGSVSGTTLVSLDATSGPLLLSGTASSPGGVVEIAATGSVAQSAGAIVAGTLVGGPVLGGAVDLGSTHNAIGVLGPLSAPGQAVAITDGAPVTVAGPVAGSSVTLAAPTLSLSGSVSGTTLVSLDANAGPLLLSGTVSSPGGVVVLAATGSVEQSGGAIVAGTLVGGPVLGGAVDLGSTHNAIGVLGSLAAPGQNVAITDGASLTVAGSVSAANVVLTDRASGVALTVAGAVTATQTLGLAAPSGTVALGGSLNAGVLDVSGEAVAQSGGTVIAGTLENTAPLGALTLIASSIGTLGPSLVASGPVSLTDARLVTIDGLTAPMITLSDPAGIVVAGSLGGANGVTLVSTAGSVGVGGTLTVGSGTLDVTASGGFGESGAAVLHVPVLASSGGVGGSGVQLAGGGNTVATLGPITASGGITLTDQAALTQTGVLSATSGNVVLADAAATGPALTLDGTILASGIVLSSTNAGLSGTAIEQPATGMLAGQGSAATSLTATAAGGSIAIAGSANRIADLQGQAPNGAITLNDAASLTVTGSLHASGAIALTGAAIAVDAPLDSAVGISLTAGNGVAGADQPAIAIASAVHAPRVALTSRNPGLASAVTETAGGAIATATLSASIASGTSNLGQFGNAISTLGAFTSPGQALILGNSAPMTISGPVSVGNFTLDTNQPVDVAGNLDVSNTWNIASSSNIAHDAGLLQVGTITGYAGHVADFGSGDLVGTLGPFSMVGSTLALDNAEPLAIDGPISAGYLAITAAGTVTLRGNIETIGLPLAEQVGTNPSAPGSYISATGLDAAIVQLGDSMVTPSAAADGPATLRLQLPLDGGGLISFANLMAPQLNLILGLQGGGSATGKIAVGSLTVLSGSGSATLSGTVGSFAGSIAAQNSKLLPRPNGRYTLNNCPLQSVSCIVLPIALVIPTNPLDELLVSVAPPEDDNLDILLPGVARKDY